MKRLTLLATTLLAACSTAPQIVPDNTSDSVILKKINHEIEHNIAFQTGWQWILWYLPLVFLVVTWGWKQFIRPCPQCEKELEENKQKTPTENSQPQQ